jgi:hypothetical protein
VEAIRAARHLLAHGTAPVDLAGAADAVQLGVKPSARHGPGRGRLAHMRRQRLNKRSRPDAADLRTSTPTTKTTGRAKELVPFIVPG